jgi:hypothetical protein
MVHWNYLICKIDDIGRWQDATGNGGSGNSPRFNLQQNTAEYQSSLLP